VILQMLAPGLGYLLLGRWGRAASTLLAALPLGLLAVVAGLESLSALLAVVVPLLLVLWGLVVSDAHALSSRGRSGEAVAWLGANRRALSASVLQLVFWVGGLGYLRLGAFKRFAACFSAVLVLVGAQTIAAAEGAVWTATLIGPVVFTVQALSAVDAWRLASAAPPEDVVQGLEPALGPPDALS